MYFPSWRIWKGKKCLMFSMQRFQNHLHGLLNYILLDPVSDSVGMENRGAGKHTFLTSHQLLLTWRNCFKNNYNFTRQTKKESFHIILLLPSTFFNLSSLYNKNTILLFICNKILLPIFHWPLFFWCLPMQNLALLKFITLILHLDFEPNL